MNVKRVIGFIICFAVLFSTLTASAVGTSAKAAVLINADTGEIIYSHNCDTRLPMASTTKIMTALLLCEYGNLEKQITVTKEMVTVEGSSMGLLPDDKVTLHDLLYGMMLASGNDAANTTAYVVGGSIENFVRLMNDRAKQLGLKNTHFVTPSGLDDSEHYTTAYELSLIAREALKNSEFAKAVSTKTATLCYGNPPYTRHLTNHNRLLKSYDDVIGVKTGFTKKSGRCLVSAAERDGKRVIAVTLHDPNDWADHRALLDYGLERVKSVEISPSAENLSVDVIAGEKKKADFNIDKERFNVSNDGALGYCVYLSKFVYAPIKKGEVLGSVCFYNGDNLIKTEQITALNDIKAKKQDGISAFLNCFKLILSSV